MKEQTLLKRTIAAVALAGALAGFGAGVADAKPMERDHKRYCAKIYSDMERTGPYGWITVADMGATTDILSRPGATTNAQ